METLVTTSASEAELAKVFLKIVGDLIKAGRISGNPEDVRIERVGKEPIMPCARDKQHNSLKLNQLEWAAKEGHFWFSGPIKSLEVDLGKGKIKENLVSEFDSLLFVKVINELNYGDITTVKNALDKIASELGFHVEYSQPDATHNITIKISATKPLSEQNAADFLHGIEKMRKAM